MKIRMTAITASALCLGLAAAAVAQDNPVATREQMMKQVGASMGALGAIAKGEKPYDAEAVKAALTTISTDMKGFPDHFPAGSEVNSAAAPAIWDNMDDFKAKALKLAGDADTVLASMPADQAGVQESIKTLGANCGTCHQTYRLKR
ncbi:c-type cytochrome [Aliirhizobium smilacinae]|uniref:Cytochrome C556 n=1 Tax=Aliirhizobium smilacinae TaxID=1395944 RepID=A0A5C4XR22_9HYPH|nr:cytochrome c [Rhizobium smilacinae]TNM65739.1 cytochrome C556 [Rhizobium smilacinae]